MNMIKYVLSFLLILFMSSVNLIAQDFEQVVNDFIEDAPNAFNNVYLKYKNNCNGNCEKILALNGDNIKGRGHFYLTISLASIGESGRKQFHNKFQDYRKKIESILSDWEKDSKLEFYYGKDTYKMIDDTDETKVTIQLQNLGGTDLIILSIEYNGISTPKMVYHVSFDPNTLYSGMEDNISLDVAAETAQEELIQPFQVLQTEAGKQAFVDLLIYAEDEFYAVKTTTNEENQWKLKTTILNPESEEPYQLLRETSQMRLELDIFLEPKYSSVSFGSEALTEAVENIIKPLGWKIFNEGASWKAVPPDNNYKRLVKKNFLGNPYLVLEVVKKKYRSVVEKYPLLRIADIIKGDCINGYGELKYLDEDSLYRYEGNFKNGLFDGLGFFYLSETEKKENPLPSYFGYFKNGKKDGPGISYDFIYSDNLWKIRDRSEYFQPSDEVMLKAYLFEEYQNDSLITERNVYWLHHSPEGSNVSYIIKSPFSLEFGNPISGDCRNGQGVLDLGDLGDYYGNFIDGKANGYGQLVLPNNEVKAFYAKEGIPRYIRTLVLPQGVSRLDAAKRRAFQLATDDCLEGDCLNGYGTALMGSADQFNIGQYDYQGFYVGSFKNTRFDGEGVIHPYLDESVTITGRYQNGKREGLFIKKYASGSEKQYFNDDNRVTETGQPYMEYLKEQNEIRKAEQKKILEQKIKENQARIAAIDKRNAEIRRRNEERRKKQSRSRRASRGSLVYEATFTGTYYSIPAFLESNVYIEDVNGRSSQTINVSYATYGGALDYGKNASFDMRGGVVHFRFDNDSGVDKRLILKDPRLLDNISPSNKFIIRMRLPSTYNISVYN